MADNRTAETLPAAAKETAVTSQTKSLTDNAAVVKAKKPASVGSIHVSSSVYRIGIFISAKKTPLYCTDSNTPNTRRYLTLILPTLLDVI